jgi:hypothetical protein
MDHLAERTGMRVLKERLAHPGTSDVTTLLIPGYKQTQAYTCGFVAGLMVLHALYPKASAEAFYRRVRPDPKMGTSNKKLIQALRQSGVSLSVVSSGLGFPEIQRNIDSGFPIITLLKTNSEDVTHWVVIYGYGIETGKGQDRVFVAGNGLPFLSQPAIPWSRFCQAQSPLGFGLVCWGRK